MKMYFKWLDEIIELNDEEDMIEGMKCSCFAGRLINNTYIEKTKDNEYICINKGNYNYYVPITSIVCKEEKVKDNNIYDDERY